MSRGRALALSTCVVASIVLGSGTAHASEKKRVLIDVDFGATWLATVPPMSIGSSRAEGPTFNALSAPSTPQMDGQWLPRIGFDLRGSFDDWYVSVIGIAFAFGSSPAPSFTFPGGSGSLGNLAYAEIGLPGGGINLGDHFALGCRGLSSRHA